MFPRIHVNEKQLQLPKRITELKDNIRLNKSIIKRASALLSEYCSWAKRRSNTTTADWLYYKKGACVSNKMNKQLKLHSEPKDIELCSWPYEGGPEVHMSTKRKQKTTKEHTWKPPNIRNFLMYHAKAVFIASHTECNQTKQNRRAREKGKIFFSSCN